jgi:hypothetical protein
MEKVLLLLMMVSQNPQVQECSNKNIIISKTQSSLLTLMTKEETKKWCSRFRRNTCNLPTITFKNPDTKTWSSVKWYRDGTTEVFITNMGTSACRAFRRK